MAKTDIRHAEETGERLEFSTSSPFLSHHSPRSPCGLFKMGWLKVTIDFVLQVTQLNGLSPLIGSGDGVQRPLQPPSIVDSLPPATNGGYGQASTYTPIVCQYPELENDGWEFCNTETSRDCWIRDPRESQPSFTQWDVRTNCAYILPKDRCRRPMDRLANPCA